MYQVGLVNSMVKAIEEDENGFIWFRTADGLSSFGRASFGNIRAPEDDECSIGSDDISSLDITEDGILAAAICSAHSFACPN